MFDVRHGSKQGVVDDAFGHQLRVTEDVQLNDECHKRPCECICVIGRHFWHLVCSISSICMQCLCLFILWKLHVNRRCCVKYVRILLFLYFILHNCRRVTYLRFCGKCYSSNVADFLLSSEWKNFWNPPIFAKVMNERKLACFWLTLWVTAFTRST